MQYVEAVGKDGKKLRVQTITKRIDVTPLDREFGKVWEDIVVGVRVEGKRIELNIDGSFYHPTEDELYSIEF